MAAPPTRRTRRPNRSPTRPASGRNRTALTNSAPTAMPTASPPPSSRLSTYTGTTGNSMPIAVKYESPAPTTSANRLVTSRCCPGWLMSQVEGGAEHDAGPAGDLLLHVQQDVARRPGDLAGDGDRIVEELVRGYDPGDQVDGACLLGVDDPARQREVAGHGTADEVVQRGVHDLAERVL